MMNSASIKAVIFDFGGVFTTSPVEKFNAYEQTHGLANNFIGGVIKSRIHDGAFSRFERGEISLAEFDAQFSAETKAAGHQISGAQFLKFLKLDPKPEMIEALRDVKNAGLKTGCITNNFPKTSNKKEPAKDEYQTLFDSTKTLFDHIIESAIVGVRKPEPRIYEMMCEALNVEARHCIFLDDLGVNLKPAQAMGMTTIKVPFGDVSPAIKTLRELTGL